MTFTRKLNRIIDPILNKIIVHPFLQKLTDGSLDQKIFHHYLVQDYYYLLEYTKALFELGEKAPFQNEKQFFNECVAGCKNEPAFEIRDLLINQKTPLTQACANYIDFFKKHVVNHYELGVGAIFPCFYIYHLVAKKLNPNNKHHPYQTWFDIYTSDLFRVQNDRIVEILERIYTNCRVEQKTTLYKIIEEGAEHEWHFWDQSYRL